MLEQKTRLLIFSLSLFPNLSLKCFELSWGFVLSEYFLIHITVTRGDIFTGGVLFLSLSWISKGGESFQSLSSCQRGSLLASFATQSECCHMPNFECFTHRQSHSSIEADVNVIATDKNNVIALNVTHRNTWIQHYIETQRYSIPWSLTYKVSLKHSVTSI